MKWEHTSDEYLGLKENIFSLNSNTIRTLSFNSLLHSIVLILFSISIKHTSGKNQRSIDIFLSQQHLFSTLHSVVSFLISLFSSCRQLVSILFKSKKKKSNVVMYRKFIFDWKESRTNKTQKEKKCVPMPIANKAINSK